MTAKDLFEAIGLVDDSLILAADAPPHRRKPAAYWRFVPLAACLCLAVGVWRSDGRLLGQVIGLVMPKGSASAPDEATGGSLMSAEAAAEAAEPTEEAEPETAEAGEQSSAALNDTAGPDGGAEAAESRKVPRTDETIAGGAEPVDTTGYDAWCEVDAARLDQDQPELPGGTLCILSDNGAPFPAEEYTTWSLTLTVTGEEGMQMEAGYVPAGGKPIPCYQGPAGAVKLSLPEDGSDGYYFYLVIQGNGTAVVSGSLSQAVRCPAEPAE